MSEELMGLTGSDEVEADREDAPPKPDEFRTWFKALTGHAPFPWQEVLFTEFLQHRFPATCDLPTGLGKTSIMAIWLLALAARARQGILRDFPRRLIYVVNRRTVVDQATTEAEALRRALNSDAAVQPIANSLRALGLGIDEEPLAISTLRGQLADNQEWSSDPARPAIIIGTIDMIGSRLLFSGYGRGFKSRPLHAGFLGQDALLIHDEAHLEPAFQELLQAIEQEQRQAGEFRRLRVLAMTATARSAAQGFGLTEADRQHPVVLKRIRAMKALHVHRVDKENEIADQVAALALSFRDSDQAILIFLRKLDDVTYVARKLEKAQAAFQLLTGTLRGLERDALATADPIFARFLPPPQEKSKVPVQPQSGTVYLICTSAGEVGVNFSGDHLICDLTPFESMAQRLGRVNRFGQVAARVELVHALQDQAAPGQSANSLEGSATASDLSTAATSSTTDEPAHSGSSRKTKADSPLLPSLERTLALLHQLPPLEQGGLDASPAALSSLSARERLAAFSPPPRILPVSSILFDHWAMTTIRGRLPGRPPVADWLHGVTDWEPPETHVAWRTEVGLLNRELLARYTPQELLETYPLAPRELLRDRTDRVFAHATRLAQHHPTALVWLIDPEGEVTIASLQQVAAAGKEELSHRTLLLAPEVGGLKNGFLDGEAQFDENILYDVADLPSERQRLWDEQEPPTGLRLAQIIDLRPDLDESLDEEEESTARRYWNWYVRQSGSRTAPLPQPLESHLEGAADFSNRLVTRLNLSPPLAEAIGLAAKLHDRGKDRAIWQRSIGNRAYPQSILAKSGGKMRPIELNGYRHELGSLLDLATIPELRALPPELAELLAHLIAAHHGRARPHFPPEEAFDPAHPDCDVQPVVAEVPRRFARLQRKYGRWGLAYLESLVRAADILASRDAIAQPNACSGSSAMEEQS